MNQGLDLVLRLESLVMTGDSVMMGKMSSHGWDEVMSIEREGDDG